MLKEVDDPRTRDLGVGDDVFGGVRTKASGEDSEAPEHGLLFLAEEVVAPVERRPEGALALGRRSPPVSEDRELVVEPVGELRRREHAQPGGGELDRERDPLERSTDPLNRIRVFDPTLSRHALCEQLDRLVAPEPFDRILGLTWYAQRLAARGDHTQQGRRREKLRDQHRRAAQYLLAIVNEQKRVATREIRPQHVPRRGVAAA